MQPKYWAITLLATAAICAGAIYYVRQPAPDLGPIVVHHISKPTPTPSTQTTVADWQTYANSQYGFSFEYPQSWQEADAFYETDGYIYFYVPHEDFAQLTLDFPTGQSIQGVASDDIKQNNCPATDDDGQPADRILQTYNNGLLYISDNCGAASANYKFVIKDKNNFVRLIYGDIDDQSLQNFEQIISTFQFISPTPTQTDTSGWKTYSNSQYGFSFEYPPKYCLATDSSQLQNNLLLVTDQCPFTDYSQSPYATQTFAPFLALSEPYILKIGQTFSSYVKQYLQNDSYTEQKLPYENVDVFLENETPDPNEPYIDGCPPSGYFILNHETNMVVVLNTFCGAGDEIVDSILPTFKFTN